MGFKDKFLPPVFFSEGEWPLLLFQNCGGERTPTINPEKLGKIKHKEHEISRSLAVVRTRSVLFGEACRRLFIQVVQRK